MVRTLRITERALVQRLRRALAKDGERLLANRGGHEPANVGAYYIVDGSNIMTNHDVDLERLGCDLDVLDEWEQVVVADEEAK